MFKNKYVYYKLVKIHTNSTKKKNHNNKLIQDLTLAVRDGHLDVVQYLYEIGMNIPKNKKSSGEYEYIRNCISNNFELACENNYISIAKYLLNNGANIEYNNGRPLRIACVNDHIDVVKFLVKNGASVNNNIYCNLSHLYKKKHSIDIVKFLIENGTCVTNNNNSPLMTACKNDNIQLIKLFIENGADINARSSTPLKICLYYEYLNTSKFLIEKGAIIDEEMLVLSILNRSNKIFMLLIENGYVVEKNKNNLLVFAACKGCLSIVEYLVKEGADISHCNNKALVLSTANGWIDVVKYLVEHGADCSADGYKSLFISHIHKHNNIHNFLKSHIKSMDVKISFDFKNIQLSVNTHIITDNCMNNEYSRWISNYFILDWLTHTSCGYITEIKFFSSLYTNPVGPVGSHGYVG